MHIVSSKPSNFSERTLEQADGRFQSFGYFWGLLVLNTSKIRQNHRKFSPLKGLGNKNQVKK